jgi:hypothetical protein
MFEKCKKTAFSGAYIVEKNVSLGKKVGYIKRGVLSKKKKNPFFDGSGLSGDGCKSDKF